MKDGSQKSKKHMGKKKLSEMESQNKATPEGYKQKQQITSNKVARGTRHDGSGKNGNSSVESSLRFSYRKSEEPIQIVKQGKAGEPTVRVRRTSSVIAAVRQRKGTSSSDKLKKHSGKGHIETAKTNEDEIFNDFLKRGIRDIVGLVSTRWYWHDKMKVTYGFFIYNNNKNISMTCMPVSCFNCSVKGKVRAS